MSSLSSFLHDKMLIQFFTFTMLAAIVSAQFNFTSSAQGPFLSPILPQTSSTSIPPVSLPSPIPTSSFQSSATTLPNSTTLSSTVQTSSSSPTPPSALPPGLVTADLTLIPSFNGSNLTGIGSWFRTNADSDDTNGQSWCRLYYDDNWYGFAANVSAMRADFGDDYMAAAEGYCGLQANLTNPENGNSVQAYLVDGFDPKWVLSTNSLDLTIAAFTSLYGSETDNKNDVIRNLTWQFTGLRATNYTFEATTRSPNSNNPDSTSPAALPQSAAFSNRLNSPLTSLALLIFALVVVA